jgi:hypothetical protein
MSDDRDDKKLLPEILPTPQPLAGAAPRERVNQRARLLLERFRSLGTTAGAAILSFHCTYGTVDPLPPPPTQCSTLPDPFAMFQAHGFYNFSPGAPTYVIIELTHQNTNGFTLSAVRVTAGGTFDSIETENPSGADWYLIQIALDPAPGPSDAGATDGSAAPADAGTGVLLFEVDVSCGGDAVTLYYRAQLPPPASGVSFTVERL